MELLQHLKKFVDEIAQGKIDLYNEPGIKYELAIYLRGCLGNKYKIQVERNIDYFDLEKDHYLKKEMDIVIFTPDKKDCRCIEVKFPTQGQHPEQMFSACKDVRFLEQLVESGFAHCYFMMFADDHLFYIDKGGSKIFKMFRNEKVIKGEIRKPTGKKDEVLTLQREYKIEWRTLMDSLRYFLIEVKAPASE
jgi:hypothetical protein